MKGTLEVGYIMGGLAEVLSGMGESSDPGCITTLIMLFLSRS
jgi:hypothetical protein